MFLFFCLCQFQITYTRKDGSKYVRVITQTPKVTKDRQEMEKVWLWKHLSVYWTETFIRDLF